MHVTYMHMLLRVKICILQIRTCEFSMYITLIYFYLAFEFELSFGPHVLKESDSCYSESLLLHGGSDKLNRLQHAR